MFVRGGRRSGSGLAGVALAVATWGGVLASAPPVPVDVAGELAYDAQPPGQIVESITENTVTMTFPPDGGSFTGVATLSLAHDVPDRGCRFTSSRRWEFSGEFRPGTRQFVGEYREVGEATQGACENFTFTRTFDPDQGRFVADLDPVAGTIMSRIDPVDFVANVDPALVSALVPDATSAAAENALTAILDEIAARQPTVTAAGEVVAPTGDGVRVVESSFSAVFNPIGGDVEVRGAQTVETTLTLEDGRTCRVVTSTTSSGAGRYDPTAGTIVGTAQTEFDRDVVDCDITADPPPARSGTIDLAVDTDTGSVTGVAGDFGVTAAFDPSELPRQPDPPFQVDFLSYGVDGDRLRIAIDWKEPWPPPKVDSLLVGGEIAGEDGPIVFGIRLDGEVSSTFMEPDGEYEAFVDDRGRTVLDVEVPGLESVGGPIIRMRTWFAAAEGDPGTLVATFDDVVDPVGSPIDGDPAERIRLPFGLPGVWAAGDDPATAGTEVDGMPVGTGAPDVGDPVAETADRSPAAEQGGPSGGSGGFPWPLLLIPLAGATAGAGYALHRRRTRPVPQAPSTVVVRVADEEGDPLAGAALYVDGVLAGVTGGDGTATVPDVGPDQPVVTVSLEGYGATLIPDRDLAAGTTGAIEVRLTSAIEETITVTSESPLLDERKLGPGMQVTATELDRIPASTDPFDVIGSGGPADAGAPPGSSRMAPGPAGELPDLVGTGGCDELARHWRQAQDDCDRESRRADDLSRAFDEHSARHGSARDELDGLPSEETRVELPDGTTLSELDLDLRRRAASAAWDHYLADPTPATARAAEDAWNRQATPEWREQQRRAHRDRRERLEREVEEAAAGRERAGADLAAARRAQREACEQAAEARRQLDECRRAAAAARDAVEIPEGAEGLGAEPVPAGGSAAEPASSDEPVASPVPPVAGSDQPPPGGATGDQPCREGTTRWVEFDGPHFFLFAPDSVVSVGVQLIAGTRREARLGSLDRSDFVVHDERGKAAAIPVRSFAGLGPADVRSAFEGQGGLAAVWNVPGSAGDQRLTIALTMRVRRALVVCERQERCVDGEWVATGAYRSRVTGDIEVITEQDTIRGNQEAGRGRPEADYLAEVVALFARMQSHVRQVVAYEDRFIQYRNDCKHGRC